jgi:hypothetical protein
VNLKHYAQLRADADRHEILVYEGEFWIAKQDRGLACFAQSFCYHAGHRSPAGLCSVFQPSALPAALAADLVLSHWAQCEYPHSAPRPPMRKLLAG